MGHTQCISKAAETEAPSPQKGERRSHELSCSGRRSGLCSHLHPEKCVVAAGADAATLEPGRVEPTHHAERLQRTMAQLYESGWYWGPVTASEAKQLLLGAVDGAFLLRDSSNPGYLFTLSVKTALGTTHLRIEYSRGEFGFDSTAMVRPQLQQFKGVVDLVQHYALAHRWEVEPGDAPAQLGLEAPLQLKLTRPLRKAVPSLQHLCRVMINQHSRDHMALSMPNPLTHYLLEYPFLL